MLKLEQSIGKEWARTCDTCRVAPSTVYCRADLAYFCSTCDTRIHGSNQLASRHERVRICEACECAPAAFLCKADAASLCATCDSDIHSANPLARRHHRVPILPVNDMNYGQFNEFLNQEGDETDEDEAASWLLMNPVKNGENGVNLDEYLDLDDFNSCQNEFNGEYGNHEQHYNCVPYKGKDEVQQHCFQLGLEYEALSAGYNYADSMSQSISLSQMDVGVVPESTRSEGSISHSRPPKGTIDLFSGSPVQTPTRLSPMEREARVLRYQEKKKTRKFEKTIRYASRKAYAETRPRIKGRFAKRNDAEGEVDQMFSTSLIAETAYGVVPSF